MASQPDDILSADEARLLAWLNNENRSLDLQEIPPEILQACEHAAGLRDCLLQLDRLAIPAPAVDEPAARAVLPREFGPYTLLAELGRGGMGVVYRARHRTLGIHVALKVIRSCEFATPDEVRRFYQEAQAAAQLRHPHIVTVHDAGDFEGVPYLVMEDVGGRTLADDWRSRPPDLQIDVPRLIRVARAVSYLHEQGVVHRDLKPSNILLDQRGDPRVTDFGLAKLFTAEGERTTTGTVLGTPAYMAPEQAWGRPEQIGTAVDLYSLGVMLYEVLTGRAPLAGLDPFEQLLRLRETEPARPSQLRVGVPAELEQICQRCLERLPQHRYPDAETLAGDLEHYQQGEPITLPPLGLAQHFRRWLRREPGLASHLAGFSTMAVIVQIADWISGGSRHSYLPIMTTLALWSAVCVILQKLLSRDIPGVKLVWVIVDGALFTVALGLAQAPMESLLLGYAMLIAATGLWYEPRLVWMMTFVAVASAMVLEIWRGNPATPGHYPAIVAGMLIVIGGITSALVKRIRQLLHRVG